MPARAARALWEEAQIEQTVIRLGCLSAVRLVPAPTPPLRGTVRPPVRTRASPAGIRVCVCGGGLVRWRSPCSLTSPLTRLPHLLSLVPRLLQ